MDRFCPLPKAYWMLRVIMGFHRHAVSSLAAGVPLERIIALPVVAEIARMKEWPAAEADEKLQALAMKLESVPPQLTAQPGKAA